MNIIRLIIARKLGPIFIMKSTWSACRDNVTKGRTTTSWECWFAKTTRKSNGAECVCVCVCVCFCVSVCVCYQYPTLRWLGFVNMLIHVVTKHILALVSLYYFNFFAGIPLTLTLVLKCPPRLKWSSWSLAWEQDGTNVDQLYFRSIRHVPAFLSRS